MKNNTKIAIESQQKADEQNTFEINIFYLLLVWLLHSVHACTHNERIIYIMYKFNDVTLLAAIAVQIFLSSTRFLIYKIKVFCFFVLSLASINYNCKPTFKSNGTKKCVYDGNADDDNDNVIEAQ